ncbi:hypothetical protein LOTGIDRAFT_161950 [Lottia gigantea]|uniref:Protein quiver n=1 Tax=Lottia gigantea TaxID=225164 RepID=V4BWK5_LOTGI|nr:hypothetical protein LOTGIDRAFT_161950 [Lottia gigantea]ESO93379.1 hypothetical protein LOTGIDRAFT_161950 [Lottia gigantea]
MKLGGDYGILCVLFTILTPVISIDCYACTSLGGNNEGCEDSFERTLKTVHFIARDCYYGYFRGTHCYKLKGERADGSSIMVRHCSDSHWGSHCGDIKYTNEHNVEEKIKGCLETCDHDGCNTATQKQFNFSLVIMAVLMTSALLL